MQKNTQKKIKKLPLNSEGVPSKNELSLNSFAEYCIGHPQERFFQALTNWFGVSRIGYDSCDGWQDLWWMEEGIDYKIK